ncbi:MAG: hypothetical protein SCH66_01600 [Methanolobus sp.]|nr:hypothetical protein [Methanolobus sp.]
MSFIEKIFGKKQKETETGPLRLEFDKLPKLIDEEYKKELGTLGPVIKEKYREIDASIDRIKDAKKSLLEAEAIADANKRAEKLGYSNRDNVAHNLDLIAEKIRVPSNSDPKDAFTFYRDSKAILKNVLDNTRRSQLYIKALYPREFENINLSLANLESLLDELYELLGVKKNKIDAFEKFPEHMEEVLRNEREMEETQKRVLDLEAKYESVKNDMTNADSRIKELERSTEFEAAYNLENDIKTLENKIYAVDSDIRRLFTPMSKALSRMEKQDKNEIFVLSPENREVLRMIKDEPASIQENELRSFLDVLEKRIENQDLGLKEQMYEKILNRIHKLKDTSAMSDLLGQREHYSTEMQALSNELNRLDVYREMERLEDKAAQYRNSVGSILGNLETEQKHLEEIEERLERSRSILNSEIKDIFGRDAEIIY